MCLPNCLTKCEPATIKRGLRPGCYALVSYAPGDAPRWWDAPEHAGIVTGRRVVFSTFVVKCDWQPFVGYATVTEVY